MDPYSAVIIVVVQAEERNMYDQHFVSAILRERYPFYKGKYVRFYYLAKQTLWFVLFRLSNVIIKDLLSLTL